MRASGRRMAPYGARVRDGAFNYCSCCNPRRPERWKGRARQDARIEIQEQVQDRDAILLDEKVGGPYPYWWCLTCNGTGAKCLSRGCGCCEECQPHGDMIRLARELAGGRLECEPGPEPDSKICWGCSHEEILHFFGGCDGVHVDCDCNGFHEY